MAENRREAALAAAAELIGRRGYAGVSMRDIAEAVGMLPGSLYYHFPSKEALFLEVHEAAVAAFHAALDRSLEGVEAPWARLEAAAAAHLSELLALGRRVAIVSPDVGALSPEGAARVLAAREGYDERFRALFAALDPAPAGPPGLARLMLMGAMNWAPVWRREGGAAPEEIAAAFVRLLREGAA
ncbi:MAG: TetR family transcriptional regulator [Pikeienuella sp.]|uniref:TetR family transcriptional regulator n=1 Tax=Pikeienuella sp. TaxID=2831957 RepID=UPI00391B287B